MNRKLSLMILLILLFVSPFFLRCTASSSQENRDWESGLLRYQMLLERDTAFLSKSHMAFEQYCIDARSELSRSLHEVEMLYFMMLQRNRYDAFTVTLYSDKISLLLNQCKNRLNEFKSLIERLAEIKAMYKDMGKELDYLTTMPLNSKQRTMLAENVEKTKKFAECFNQMDSEVESLKLELNKKFERIEAIYQISSERQDQVIRTIFFDNESSFMKTSPQAIVLIKYWLYDSYDSINVQLGSFNHAFWTFIWYATSIVLLLCASGYLSYRKLLRRLLMNKLPDIFARRTQFFANFILLFFGLSVYWGELLTDEFEMQAFRQLSVGVIMLASLRLALALRLDKPEQKRTLPAYHASAAIYFICIVLSIGMISYRPLIIVSTVLSVFAVIFTLIPLRRFRQLELIDRIFGFLGAANFAIAAVIGFLGFAYISLTMLSVWFVIVAQFQAILGIGKFVQRFISADSRHPIFNQILSHFMLPVAWLWMLTYLVEWTARTYHVEERMYALMDYNIVQRANIAEFNLREVLIVVIVGIVLYFVITCGRLFIKAVVGDSAEFGLLPSFVILLNYVLWALYVIFVLVMFRVQYSSILVVVGGLSMGLGFGLKEIVENFIAGLILLIGQQVRPGDVVEIKGDGIFGRVRQVSVRATVVETFDGAVITYPNAQVLTREFLNWTSNHMLQRRDLSVGVAYGSNIALVFKLLNEVSKTTPGVVSKPAPEVLFVDFGNNSIDFKIRFWTLVSDGVCVCSRLRQEIYGKFEENGVNIPFPQLDLHIIGEGAAKIHP